MNVRLTQIDGKLPNLALMKLAHWYRGQGAEITFSKHVERDMLEPAYDRVYGSAIFSFSADRVERFRRAFPNAIVGGTWDTSRNETVERTSASRRARATTTPSIPTSTAQLASRSAGAASSAGSAWCRRRRQAALGQLHLVDLAGRAHPKHIHLLDNDFFGQPREDWEARIAESATAGSRSA
jgi:hypothetical protein